MTTKRETKKAASVKVTEEYMNPQQLAHFEKALLDWKESIYRESERTRAHLKDEAVQTADLNDRATLEEEFSLELRARDRERKLLRKIDKALERIANNEFGWCEKCGEEIGIGRLEARPTAELCIDCKEIAERQEKSLHDSR